MKYFELVALKYFVSFYFFIFMVALFKCITFIDMLMVNFQFNSKYVSERQRLASWWKTKTTSHLIVALAAAGLPVGVGEQGRLPPRHATLYHIIKCKWALCLLNAGKFSRIIYQQFVWSLFGHNGYFKFVYPCSLSSFCLKTTNHHFFLI